MQKQNYNEQISKHFLCTYGFVISLQMPLRLFELSSM